MKRPRFAAAAAGLITVAVSLTVGAGKAMTAPPSSTDLKTEKLKTIYRREPRAQGLIPKVEANIAKLKASPETASYGNRLENELNRIEMHSPSKTDAHLKDDIDLLEAAAGNLKPPTTEELKPLQERYEKIAGDLDDTVLVKDYERVLKRHDRLIRYTSLGLWDKDKIASELQKLEEMIASAPDITYGRAEALRGLQNRKLTPVKNLVYLGTYPHEEVFLSPDRLSVTVLDEVLGGTVQIETADLTVRNPDGKFIDLTTVNNPANGIPFSPPLSLWMKTRMAEGRVPAITFRLAEYDADGKPVPAHSEGTAPLGVQDVLDGKLDDYFKKNIATIADTKEAAIVGLFDNFDQELAENAFGADGRTPFYMLDPKLSKLPADAAQAEFLKRTEKGTYASAKTALPDLSNQYGDPAIPDGPERVKDAWLHIKQVIGKTGPNLAYYSTAGAFHGSKNAFKFPQLAYSGTQAWNKLEYYWPGPNVLDWVGVQAIGPTPVEEPKGANITEAVDPFFSEVGASKWQGTPVMLRGAAPGNVIKPESEAAWIATLFQKMIKGDYPATSVVFVEAPAKLTLWTRDAASAYRSNVASDKFYKWPLRFKMLEENGAK